MSGLSETWLQAAGELLFPRYCLVCGRVLQKKRLLCQHCHPRLDPAWQQPHCCLCCELGTELDAVGRCASCCRLSLPFRSICFLWPYDERGRALIHALKYRPSLKLAQCSGRLLGRCLAPQPVAQSWQRIIPMPSAPASLRQRGFNQCAVLAQEVHRLLPQLCFDPLALKHCRRVQPQASLPHSQRRQNIQGALRSRQPLNGQRVLLIDDVITTGATSSAAAQALLQAGAASVDLAALARSETWLEYRSDQGPGITPPELGAP